LKIYIQQRGITMQEKDYTQLVVWPATMLGDASAEDFEKFIKETFSCRAKFCEEVITLPDVVNGLFVEDTGGRHDLLFYVHNDDLGKFAVPRLAYGIRWWEDVLDNMVNSTDAPIYSTDILKKYPYGWDNDESAFCDKYSKLLQK